MYYTNFAEDTIEHNIDSTPDTITNDTDKFQQFIIYKCEVNSNIYIGSTFDLKKRISEHKNRTKLGFNNKLYNYFNDNNIEFNENYFTEIFKSGKLIANTEDEKMYNKVIKFKKEREFQDYYNSVKNGLNDRFAWTSDEEKSIQMIEFNKKHNNIKVTCDCGIDLLKQNITRHKKTKIHKSNMINLKWESLVKKLLL
jgi:hypothetical protein